MKIVIVKCQSKKVTILFYQCLPHWCKKILLCGTEKDPTCCCATSLKGKKPNTLNEIASNQARRGRQLSSSTGLDKEGLTSSNHTSEPGLYIGRIYPLNLPGKPECIS